MTRLWKSLSFRFFWLIREDFSPLSGLVLQKFHGQRLQLRPGLRTPLMVMHMCSASITTALKGFKLSFIQSAIWEVSLSCNWGAGHRLCHPGQLAYSHHFTAAGDVGYMSFAVKGSKWCSHIEYKGISSLILVHHEIL